MTYCSSCSHASATGHHWSRLAGRKNPKCPSRVLLFEATSKTKSVNLAAPKRLSTRRTADSVANRSSEGRRESALASMWEQLPYEESEAMLHLNRRRPHSKATRAGRSSGKPKALPGKYPINLVRSGIRTCHRTCLLYTSPSPRDRQKSR